MVWYERAGLAPDEAAREHSHRLARHIDEVLTDAGGWLDFARFMELALYAPGLGYYAAGAVKLGREGDFVTAPEMTPLFARTLANPIARTLASLDGSGEMLELGAGSGQLAFDLLLSLQQQQALPTHYWIMEVSPDLRSRQRDRLAELPDDLFRRVSWCERWPEQIRGVVLANEVLDAMPAQRLRWHDGRWYQAGVARMGGHWGWEYRWLEDETLLEGLPDMTGYPDPYDTEVAPVVEGVMATLASSLVEGRAFLIDYGFPAREYYHPQRSGGTLMCHYRHHAHGDPLVLPGLQDITVHVDFTRVAQAARRYGLRLEAWAGQAQWLMDEGIVEHLESLHRAVPVDYRQLGAAQKLLSPAEMGELFKVLVVGHGSESQAALTALGLGEEEPNGSGDQASEG